MVNVFFSLLRSALWGTPAEVPHDFKDWNNIVHLSKAQSVMGLVGDVMLNNPELSSRFKEKAKERLWSFIFANKVTHEKQDRALVRAVNVLKEAGIHPVLLKGRGLAQYYPAPNLRQCGDIDLYVGRSDYRKAYEVLKPLSMEIDDIRKLDTGIHFDADIDGTDVEVHRFTETYPAGRFNNIYQTASDKGMSDGLVPMHVLDAEVDTPADVFNAFYVFSHMFRHFLFEGVGFRQICDWMMFLHARNGKIDEAALKVLIESMDMMKPWQAFGCLLVDVLGLPENEFPLFDGKYRGLVGKITARILDEGNFGKQRDVFTKRGDIYIFNKMRSFIGHIKRTFCMFSIFPKHAFRQIRHTMAEALGRVWTDARIRFGRNMQIK